MMLRIFISLILFIFSYLSFADGQGYVCDINCKCVGFGKEWYDPNCGKDGAQSIGSFSNPSKSNNDLPFLQNLPLQPTNSGSVQNPPPRFSYFCAEPSGQETEERESKHREEQKKYEKEINEAKDAEDRRAQLIHKQYSLKSPIHYRLSEVVLKYEQLKAKKPTTTNDTLKVEYLIHKADDFYLKHEDLKGNAFASFASNLMEFTNFDDPIKHLKDWRNHRDSRYYPRFVSNSQHPFGIDQYKKELNDLYSHLYINDIVNVLSSQWKFYETHHGLESEYKKHTFKNIYEAQYAIAAVETIKTINKNYPNDDYIHFHASMALARLSIAKDNQNFEEFMLAYENVVNLNRYMKGISNFFEQLTTEFIAGPTGLYMSAVKLISAPIDSVSAFFSSLANSPELMWGIKQQVDKTWQDIPNFTFEDRMAFYGKVVGMLVSSFGLAPGAVKTLTNSHIHTKALEATGELYLKTAYDFAKIEHFGPWNVTPDPLSRIRRFDFDTGLEGVAIKDTLIRDTFKNSHYIRRETFEGETYYRLWSDSKKEHSNFLTTKCPTCSSHAIKELALLPEYQNTAEYVTKYVFPKGEIVYEGFVAPQGNLPGGGRQIFLDKNYPEILEYLKKYKVGESWRIPHD